MKPPTGNKLVCTYCGAVNPDSEATCPDTGGRHSLVSSADKEKIGQGYGPGPGDKTGRPTTLSGQHEEDYKKESHGFAQTDTVKHCPFCGSGDVWGGSDGTITCEFDGATFQVSVEPQYPSAPGNIGGQPLNIDGEPDPFGQAGAGDAYAVPEGVAPSSGDQLGLGDEEGDGGDEEGGPPWANGGDGDEDEDQDEDQDEDEEGQAPPPFPPKKSYRTYLGDLLSEELYIKHLAVRHAEDRPRFLASLRSTAEVINRTCPDFDAHNKDAEMTAWPMFRHTGDELRKMYKFAGERAQRDYEECDGTGWAHSPHFEEAYQDFKHRQQHEGLAGSASLRSGR